MSLAAIETPSGTDGQTESVNDAISKKKVEFVIPSDKAGLVIGRGGAQLKEIQAECGCNLKVGPDEGFPLRLVVAWGDDEDALERARCRVLGLIAASVGAVLPASTAAPIFAAVADSTEPKQTEAAVLLLPREQQQVGGVDNNKETNGGGSGAASEAVTS